MKLQCVYFATPEFSLACLEILKDHPLVDLFYVVSIPDRKSARGQKLHSPEIVNFCQKFKIKTIQTDNINKEHEFLELCLKNKVDLFIVLSFSQFLNKETLSIPKIGAFNIHTSLLPKYRGAAPIQYALLNGDRQTGVSIQKMIKKMDAGDLCHFKQIAILPHDHYLSLSRKLKFLSALCLDEFIDMLSKDLLTFKPQDEKEVSFAPSILKSDGVLDFSSDTFETVVNKFKAFYSWPGFFFKIGEYRYKLIDISFKKSKTNHLNMAIGQLYQQDTDLWLKLKDGSLNILSLQLDGKKIISSHDFINGHKKLLANFN